jgi:hypothetical protein
VLLDGFSLTIASLIFGIIAVTDQSPALNINLLLRLSVGVARNTHQLIRKLEPRSGGSDRPDL